MSSSRLLCLLVLLSSSLPFAVTRARAQDDECLPRPEIEARRASIRGMMSEENWSGARTAIDALVAACPYDHGLSCEGAIVMVQLDATQGEPIALPEELLSPRRRAQHADCAGGLGLAYASAVARNPAAPLAARLAEHAAFWLGHERALRPWRSAERRAYAALPRAARVFVEGLPARQRAPVVRAVGEQPSLEALAAALSLELWRRSPADLEFCSTVLDSLGGLTGDAESVTTLNCGLAFESYTVYTTYFVERSTAGGYRLVASAPEPGEGICTADLDQKLSFTRLTPAAHGFDGYLMVRRLGGAGSDSRFSERRVSTVAMVCSRLSGECRHREIGRITCVSSDADAAHSYQCAENWEGVPAVRRGRLTLTLAERTELDTPSDPLPRPARGPIALGRGFGTLKIPPVFSAQRDKVVCRLAGDRCR